MEPWDALRVRFSVPREAALRLRQLSQQSDSTLRSLGILSVCIGENQMVSLTVAGRDGQPQQLSLPVDEQRVCAAPSQRVCAAPSQRVCAAPSQRVCAAPSQRNVTDVLSQAGGGATVNGLQQRPASALPVVPSPTRPLQFRSPNVVAPPSQPLAFRLQPRIPLRHAPPPPYPGPEPIPALSSPALGSPLLVNLLKNEPPMSLQSVRLRPALQTRLQQPVSNGSPGPAPRVYSAHVSQLKRAAESPPAGLPRHKLSLSPSVPPPLASCPSGSSAAPTRSPSRPLCSPGAAALSPGASSGKPRQLLINPLTGLLEPTATSDSSSDSESELLQPQSVPSAPRSAADESAAGASSDAETLRRAAGSVRLLADPAVGDKIRLRLKLEKSEPVSPAYKVDVSFSGAATAALRRDKCTSNGCVAPLEPRVPPLHISLRGRNAAVVVPKDKLKNKPTKLTLKTLEEGMMVQAGISTAEDPPLKIKFKDGVMKNRMKDKEKVKRIKKKDDEKVFGIVKVVNSYDIGATNNRPHDNISNHVMDLHSEMDLKHVPPVPPEDIFSPDAWNPRGAGSPPLLEAVAPAPPPAPAAVRVCLARSRDETDALRRGVLTSRCVRTTDTATVDSPTALHKPDPANGQGEDSGIESMDTQSEKSPNQDESPHRKEELDSEKHELSALKRRTSTEQPVIDGVPLHAGFKAASDTTPTCCQTAVGYKRSVDSVVASLVAPPSDTRPLSIRAASSVAEAAGVIPAVAQFVHGSCHSPAHTVGARHALRTDSVSGSDTSFSVHNDSCSSHPPTVLPVTSTPPTSIVLPVTSTPPTSTVLLVTSAPSTSTVLPVTSPPPTAAVQVVAPSTSTVQVVAPSTSTVKVVAPSTSTVLPVTPATPTSNGLPVTAATPTATVLPVTTSPISAVLPVTSAPLTSTVLPVTSVPPTSTVLPVTSTPPTSTVLPVTSTPSTSAVLPVTSTAPTSTSFHARSLLANVSPTFPPTSTAQTSASLTFVPSFTSPLPTPTVLSASLLPSLSIASPLSTAGASPVSTVTTSVLSVPTVHLVPLRASTASPVQLTLPPGVKMLPIKLIKAPCQSAAVRECPAPASPEPPVLSPAVLSPDCKQQPHHQLSGPGISSELPPTLEQTSQSLEPQSSVATSAAGTESAVATSTARTGSAVSMSPARTESAVTTSAARTDSAVSTSPARTESAVSTSPIRTESAVSTSPARTESAVSTSPIRTESAVSTSPARTESAVSTSPIRTDSAVSTSPARTESAVATSAARTESAVSTSPVRTESSVSTSLIRAESAVSTSPVRTESAVSTSPVRTESSVSTSLIRAESAVSTSPVRTESAVSTSHVRAESAVSTSHVRAESAVSTSPVGTESPMSTSHIRMESAVSMSPARTELVVSVELSETPELLRVRPPLYTYSNPERASESCCPTRDGVPLLHQLSIQIPCGEETEERRTTRTTRSSSRFHSPRPRRPGADGSPGTEPSRRRGSTPVSLSTPAVPATSVSVTVSRLSADTAAAASSSAADPDSCSGVNGSRASHSPTELYTVRTPAATRNCRKDDGVSDDETERPCTRSADRGPTPSAVSQQPDDALALSMASHSLTAAAAALQIPINAQSDKTISRPSRTKCRELKSVSRSGSTESRDGGSAPRKCRPSAKPAGREANKLEDRGDVASSLPGKRKLRNSTTLSLLDLEGSSTSKRRRSSRDK